MTELPAYSRESLRSCTSWKFSSVGVNHSSGGTEIACNSVLKAVSSSQPSGKNSSSAAAQAAAVGRARGARGGGEGGREGREEGRWAGRRGRGARAEATPASKLSRACLKIKNVTLVLASPGPPLVVVLISAKMPSRKIISIITTTATERARCGMYR